MERAEQKTKEVQAEEICNCYTVTYWTMKVKPQIFMVDLFFFKFYFIFKLYNIVLVLPNIEMNPPQVYMCSPS